MHVQLNPVGAMALLSQLEVDRLKNNTSSDAFNLFRNCCLAVLNVGSHTDSSSEIYDQYKDFEVNLLARERGIKIELFNPPQSAFVDGQIIRGIHEHLFAVLRDILFFHTQLTHANRLDLQNSDHITHTVYDILRNARVIDTAVEPNMIVCWGGHSINEAEYKDTKEVG